MTFCTRCGKQLDDGLKFCTACGTPIGGTQDADGATPARQAAPASDPVAVQAAEPTAKPKKSPRVIVVALIVLVLAAGLGCGAWVWLSGSSSQPSQEAASDPNEGEERDSEAPSAQEASSVDEDAAAADAPSEVRFSGITSVTASSVLPIDGVNNRGYEAANVIDGDTQHAWIEDAYGPGAGEWLILKGNGTQGFSGFDIWNGYQESEDIYFKNARPSYITAYVDGKKVGTFHLADSGLTSQHIDFGDTFVGKELKIVIDDVYPGSKYEDCAISELRVF